MAKRRRRVPTPADLRAYIDAGSNLCPYCGNEDVEGDGVEIDGKHARQEVSCTDCNKSWTDVYTLSGVDVVDGKGRWIIAAPPPPDEAFLARVARLLEGARAHGENSEPDHEVGDLQQFLTAAARLLTPGQQARFWASDDLTTVVRDGVDYPDLAAEMYPAADPQ